MDATNVWRLSEQQNHVEEEIKSAEQFRSRYATVVDCNINNLEYHVRRRLDRKPGKIYSQCKNKSRKALT